MSTGGNTLTLPLHSGTPPQYLVKRMIKLSGCISKVLVDYYGTLEFLKRLSDPLWFQAFGCVLGFDWHSSGVTTVVMSVLKESVLPDSHGVAITGGKGKKSKDTLNEIHTVCEDSFNFSDVTVEKLSYASKMSAKVDNSAIQDGYSLYHHNTVFDERGHWSIVQQGMNNDNNTSRRYHWMSTQMKDENFVIEPHSGLIGELHHNNKVLNMTSIDSLENQKTSLDILRDHTNIQDLFLSLKPLISRGGDRKLDAWIVPDTNTNADRPLHCLEQNQAKGYTMPKRVDWDLVRQIHEIQPSNYEKFLSIKGVGTSTIRAISLISELIFGSKTSWDDPIRFTFALGGKDGVPHPIDRKSYDQSISYLQSAIDGAEISFEDRVKTLKRLANYNSGIRDQI